jgi:hypothetical protein
MRFESATLESDSVKGADALASTTARETLRELGRAGFAREQDILTRRSKKVEDMRATLEALKASALVATEYVLACKKTQTPLTHLADPLVLKSDDVGTLLCPSCGATFSDENLAEGYRVSELGRQLIQSSHWLTVWVTQKLATLGIPLASILWNVTEGSEEVDIVVDLGSQTWILELKDREFGAGDAHPFNYRKARYRATRAIIVTTDRVSADAKRVFEELAKETRGHSGAGPIFIEGLDNATTVLSREIATATLADACSRILFLQAMSPYDLQAIVAARFALDRV